MFLKLANQLIFNRQIIIDFQYKQSWQWKSYWFSVEKWSGPKHTDFQLKYLYWFSTQKRAFLSSNSSSKCTVNSMGNFVLIFIRKMILTKINWFSMETFVLVFNTKSQVQNVL